MLRVGARRLTFATGTSTQQGGSVETEDAHIKSYGRKTGTGGAYVRTSGAGLGTATGVVAAAARKASLMRAEHLAVSGNHVFWRYVSEYGRATRLLWESSGVGGHIAGGSRMIARHRAISAHELMQRMHNRMEAPWVRQRQPRPTWGIAVCRRVER